MRVIKNMDLVWKHVLLLTIGVLISCTVSVKTETDSDISPESLQLLLSPKLYEALADLSIPSNEAPVATLIASKPSSRRKRFSPSSRVDSKVTKLKTPKSDDDDADVPVIRGLAGLSPIEVRLLNPNEDQDDGRLIRTTTTTEKTRNEKSLHKKKDVGDVPVISGTKDPNHPSRQDALERKSDDDDTVVLLNGATAQRTSTSHAPPPSFPPQRPPGGKTRCEQRKLLLQLDEQLAVLRKLNEQRDADISRSMSWVAGAGGPDADFRGNAQQIPNVPIPYIPYVSNLPIYVRSDWTPLSLPPSSYEYQVSGNPGPPIAGIYRKTWVPPPVPADSINCDYEDDGYQPNQAGIVISTPAPNSFRRPGFDDRSLHNSGGYVPVSTPAPNAFQRPGFDNRPLQNPGGYVSTSAPNVFQRPGFDDRSLRNPGGYVSTSAPNVFQRPGFDDRSLSNPGGYVPTSAPNAYQGPGFDTRPLHNPGGIEVSTSTLSPNSFRRPGFDYRNLRNPGGYGVLPTPGTLRRDGSYGRAYIPGAPRVEIDDKLAKPKDDPAEDEEQE